MVVEVTVKKAQNSDRLASLTVPKLKRGYVAEALHTQNSIIGLTRHVNQQGGATSFG